MGTIQVCGGGMQVVQYRTASGNTSKRLAYNECEDIEVNDSGDQLWVDFCVFTCGAPSDGPVDVQPGDTTADGKVTLEFAECLGACEGAPAVMVNDEHRHNMTPEKVEELVANLRE